MDNTKITPIDIRIEEKIELLKKDIEDTWCGEYKEHYQNTLDDILSMVKNYKNETRKCTNCKQAILLKDLDYVLDKYYGKCKKCSNI